MRLRALTAAGLVAALMMAGCGDDDDATVPTVPVPTDDGPAERFCDVYLEYLAAPTVEWLDAVAKSSADADVEDFVRIIVDDAETGRVLAATEDLDAAARERCQGEWIAGAQGAGNAAAAAQAFLDALVAGDPVGARFVAAANAVAVFEPWTPIEPDPEAGTPTVLEVDDRRFAIALSADRIAECQVEIGVVIACLVVS